MNTDFKVILTPQHNEPVYSQSLPTRTILKDDLLVELVSSNSKVWDKNDLIANFRPQFLPNENHMVN